MAISIDWATKIISVPQSYLTFISGNLYELDTDQFRLDLKGLEDGEEGIIFDDTHQHNTEVTVGGVTLARVVEIINGYTITFEDGSYRVRLAGSNNNFSDVANLNSVSLLQLNSAGLISATGAADIADAVWDEAIAGHQTGGTAGDLMTLAGYAGAVWIDTVNGSAGATIGVNGTKTNPSSSLANAITLATALGLRHFKILGDSVLAVTTDLEDYFFEGETSGLYLRPVVQIVSGSVARTTFRKVTLVGDLTDTGEGVAVLAEQCILTSLSGIACGIIDRESTFSDTGDLEFEQNGALFSYGGHGIISMVCNDAGVTVELQRWDGKAAIEMTTGCTCTILHRSPSPVAVTGDGGTLNLYGPATVDDQSSGVILNVFARDVLNHSLREAYVLDGGPGNTEVILDAQGLLLSGRVRVFASPAKATAATLGAADGADGEIWAWDITGANTGVPGFLANLKMIGQ
jgi:hypothetical protein